MIAPRKGTKSVSLSYRPLIALVIGVFFILAFLALYNYDFTGRSNVQAITITITQQSPSSLSAPAIHQNASRSFMNITLPKGGSTVSPIPVAEASKPMQKASRPSFSSETAAASLSKPVVISVVTSHYLGNYQYKSSPSDACPLLNPIDNKTVIQLDCEIQASASNQNTADALWYHLPNIQGPGQLQRHHPKQVRAGFSMESNIYYGQQANPALMKELEIKMTYEMDSDVVVMYYWEDPSFSKPPSVPFSKKSNAVGYVNRNCGALNGRHNIVVKLSKVYEVDAYGCMGNGARVDKLDFFSKQKFCIAMENSNSKDYVSEKLWQAFQAGCLPIYMGAPNIIQDFLPMPNAAIVYDPSTSTPEKLAEELKKLEANETLYNEAMAWRTLPFEKLSPGYKRLVTLWKGQGRTECHLCRQVALWRLAKEQPGPLDVSWFVSEASMNRLQLQI